MKFKTITELSMYLDPKDIFRITSLDDVNSWMDTIERQIRNHTGYKFWRWRIKYQYQEQTCAVLGLDTSKLEYTKVDYHHVIFLHYIVITTAKKLLDDLTEKDYITMGEIVDQVIDDHLDDLIGYIPLTITSHSQIHDELLKVPRDKILGSYEEWMEKYQKQIDEIPPVKKHIDEVLFK